MPEKVNYNPDILSCLANLSSDEVFTPPEIANSMLDMLPQELFKSPDTKFLDPGCKSGVFLREIAKRLNDGLKDKIPDVEQRMDHIMKNQLFAIAITQITGLMSRRSVYCSKDASSRFSITRFENSDGNIRYRRIEHTWENGRCAICGASKDVQDRGEELESHAYEFIHMDKTTEKELKDMKFDVIIGNPPYQMSTNEEGIQAIPLYDKFVEQAKKLNPHYISMIIPSRWFNGGMGMDGFRKNMLRSRHIRFLNDYQKSRDCFPGVDIAGGVCYFLWDRQYSGPCNVNNSGENRNNSVVRYLDEFDTFIRDNIGVGIVKKVLGKTSGTFLNTVVESISPFGISTKIRGSENCGKNSVKLFTSAGVSYLPLGQVPKGLNYIGQYKVSIGQLNPDRGGVNNSSDGKSNVITKIKIYKPNEIFSATYLLLGSFNNESLAKNYSTYISTKFVRFLVFQTLSSMHITKESFRFVPSQDFTKSWTDEELYAKYGLSDEEIAFIESMIKPMDIEGGADA